MVHAVAPVFEYVPTEQEAEQALAPVEAEYLPAEQLVHDEAEASEYVPAGHVAQSSPETYFPAEQESQTDAPADAYFPLEHTVQEVDPPEL